MKAIYHNISLTPYFSGANFYNNQMNDGRVDYAIGVDVPVDDVTRAETDRDVWVYNGDLDVKEYGAEVVSTQDADTAQTGATQ